MFADDLILLMKGSLIEINFQLQKIFKIIKDFGMNPNDDKTKKTLIPKEILYLGGEGTKDLKQALKDNQALIRLNLSKNEIENKGIKFLSRALRRTTRVLQNWFFVRMK
ncbi:leucine-rich repeat isoform f-related [Anaeramoeba flamelloides]|uniref:Leucine-rich repeat isoform f-related n=1 Tax=Anaeramoeba flamelloides TaxID=1746091 RepID=A0AAV7YKA3_9EUKA|nr:leucine-rich repeat isoform f-related [Anaeramoeba flamelloides]